MPQFPQTRMLPAGAFSAPSPRVPAGFPHPGPRLSRAVLLGVVTPQACEGLTPDPVYPADSSARHTWAAADCEDRGKWGSRAQEGRRGQGSRGAGRRKLPGSHHPGPTNPASTDPGPLPTHRSRPLPDSGRLGTRGRFNNISGEMGSPGMGTTLLRETFPALTPPLQRMDRGGSFPGPGTPQG